MMGFFGRGVEVGNKEAMVAVGALRSCGSLGFANAEALKVVFFKFFFDHIQLFISFQITTLFAALAYGFQTMDV
jgi:hypothetical protein